MVSLFMKTSIFSTQTIIPTTYPVNPIRISPCSCKKSDFQDYRDYVKPSRLLQTTPVKLYSDNCSMLNGSKFNTLYKVKLKTSTAYGSDFSDTNSELLLCLIDENGDSVLQRVPAVLGSDHLLFRRGSVDEFVFEGPRLGHISAVWISPESGQWRLGGMAITLISQQQQQCLDSKQVEIDFDIEDVLLGDKSDCSMMEFRPCLVTESSSVASPTPVSTSPGTQNISNEDTMKEYADLKLSLLLYDVMLTLAGSSIAYLTGEKAALAFLAGGIGGFLYLLLVQRSVDGISSTELSSSNRTETLDRTDKGFKGSVSSIVLALGVTTVAARYVLGDVAVVITPKDLMFGTIGFLLCKVAVVLAAFRPITGLRENK